MVSESWMMKKEARVGRDFGTEHSNQRKCQKGEDYETRTNFAFSRDKEKANEWWEKGYKIRS